MNNATRKGDRCYRRLNGPAGAESVAEEAFGGIDPRLAFAPSENRLNGFGFHLVVGHGARAVCVTGLVLVAIGLAIISRVGTSTPYLLMLAGLIPLGIGMGAAMTPATAAITEALPRAQQGVGSALNDLSREVGGALGTAVIGSIVTAVYRSSLQLRGVPAPLVNQAQQSFAIAIHTGGPIGTGRLHG